jgi:hypothetical protein
MRVQLECGETTLPEIHSSDCWPVLLLGVAPRASAKWHDDSTSYCNMHSTLCATRQDLLPDNTRTCV